MSLELNDHVEKAWMSQALSVFHARGITLDEDLRAYKLVLPYASLTGYISESEAERELRLQQPIYLFAHLPPPNVPKSKTSSLHHWSLQESDYLPLSPEACRELGLPIELELIAAQRSFPYTWSTDTYTLVRQYQLLRNFDPATIDFAQHVGFNEHIFRALINESDRFEVVDEDSTDTDTRTNIERESTASNHAVNKHHRNGAGIGGSIEHRQIHAEQNNDTKSRQTIGEPEGRLINARLQGDRLPLDPKLCSLDRYQPHLATGMGHQQTSSTASSIPYPTQQRHSVHSTPSHLSPADVPACANVVNMAWTSPSSFYPQTMRSSEMSQYERAGTSHDPITSHWDSSNNDDLDKPTIYDRNLAYADPATYTIDTDSLYKSVVNNMDSAYSDPAIYAVNTTATSDGDLKHAILPPTGGLSEKVHEGLWLPEPFHQHWFNLALNSRQGRQFNLTAEGSTTPPEFGQGAIDPASPPRGS
ncbi:hypothetical protein PQX77_014180 [Marasmius sp. AFHP31]|nr:hypothetical protein PQX77_014180 [Marasmius sp. AFHP31]